MTLRRLVLDQVRHHRGLHKVALKAYSLRHPPPYRLPNMEFESDAWSGISSLHYRGGRQLGDDNAGPYPYGETTHNQYEPCRFSDGRHGLPMNRTTLRLVLPQTKEVHQLAAVIRGKYVVHRGLPSGGLSLVKAHLLSKISASLPAYLTRRRENPVPDGDLPPLGAAFYMLGAAPFMLMRNMLGMGLLECLDPHAMSAQRLYESSDACGVLISGRGRACPASPKLILDFFDVFMNGSIEGVPDSPEVQRVMDLLGDWDRFFAYALAASRIDVLIRLNKALTARALIPPLRGASQSCNDEPGLLRATLAAVLGQSHVRVEQGTDLFKVFGGVRDGLVALLLDHGEGGVVNSLRSLNCLASPDAEPDACMIAAARRIGSISEVVTQACQRNLLQVQETLGRSGWPDISVADVLRRTGGLPLIELMAVTDVPRRAAA